MPAWDGHARAQLDDVFALTAHHGNHQLIESLGPNRVSMVKGAFLSCSDKVKYFDLGRDGVQANFLSLLTHLPAFADKKAQSRLLFITSRPSQFVPYRLLYKDLKQNSPVQERSLRSEIK